MNELPGPAQPLRLGLVATDEIRIAGLRDALEPACELVLLADPGMLSTLALEIVLIDSGVTEHLLELMASFRRLRPQTRLLVLGVKSDLNHIEQIIGAGAKGYVAHTALATELKKAVAVVADHSIWAPRKVLARLLERGTRNAAMTATPQEIRFSEREAQVLQLLVKGSPNRLIAQELGIEESTVKAHLGRAMRKCGVNNRTSLSMLAMERGWLTVLDEAKPSP